jgi:hypothetical protein
LEQVKEEEEEAYENIPESIQGSENGERMQEGINVLENAISSLEEAIDGITEAL